MFVGSIKRLQGHIHQMCGLFAAERQNPDDNRYDRDGLSRLCQPLHTRKQFSAIDMAHGVYVGLRLESDKVTQRSSSSRCTRRIGLT